MDVNTLDQLPAETLIKVMGLLPLPSLFSLASTCSRLYHLLANPSLWRTLDLNPSKISHHQGSFRDMLKDKGEHVREITLRNKDLLAGKDKLVLKYAVELCGSNLTSLAVSNLKVVDLKLIASCCGVLMSLSIGDLILEDMHRVLPWLSASPNKFKHLEHFAAYFWTDNDALCDHCRLIQTTTSSRKFLQGLVKSNSSLKKMVLGGMSLGKSLQRMVKEKGISVEITEDRTTENE